MPFFLSLVVWGIVLYGVLALITPLTREYVLVYSETCPHCKPVIPIFKQLQRVPIPGKRVRLVSRESDSQDPIFRNVKVEAFPTMVAYDVVTYAKQHFYDGERNLKGILKWILTQ